MVAFLRTAVSNTVETRQLHPLLFGLFHLGLTGDSIHPPLSGRSSAKCPASDQTCDEHPVQHRQRARTGDDLVSLQPVHRDALLLPLAPSRTYPLRGFLAHERDQTTKVSTSTGCCRTDGAQNSKEGRTDGMKTKQSTITLSFHETRSVMTLSGRVTPPIRLFRRFPLHGPAAAGLWTSKPPPFFLQSRDAPFECLNANGQTAQPS
jgi:hypothetical protein